jgi:hypothetical protein
MIKSTLQLRYKPLCNIVSYRNLFKLCYATYAEVTANKDELNSKYRLGSTNLCQQQSLCSVVTMGYRTVLLYARMLGGYSVNACGISSGISTYLNRVYTQIFPGYTRLCYLPVAKLYAVISWDSHMIMWENRNRGYVRGDWKAP